MNASEYDLPKLYFGRRLSARLLDFLFAALLALILKGLYPHVPLVNAFSLYLFYNLLVAAAKGDTLGRFAFLLKIVSDRCQKPSPLLLIFREIAFIFLLPLVCLNLLGFPHRALHDRICRTRIVKDGR